MRSAILFLLSGIIICTQLYGQTQTVRGTILDLDAQTPLIGATVQLTSDDPIGTITDNDGHFRLENIPIGRHSFVVQFLGYELQYLKEINVTPSREVILDIKLKESVTELNEVTIKANGQGHEALNEMSMISARSMSIEELNRQPANFYDPANGLEFFGCNICG